MIATALALCLAATETPGLAVMDFAVEGVAPEVGSAVSGLVAHELERLQLFRVNSAETTRVILGVERQRALLGCDNCSAANLSELTSFEYLVTGKLLRTGTGKDAQYNLLLSLLKTGQSAPLSSARLQARGEEQLLSEVPATTLKLVGKLLEGRQGALVVGSSELGASVKVDDTQVGTTPLQSRVQVAAGPHLLSIEKEGFTQVKKEVRITADQVSDEFIRLVPSPDMAELYEARATRMRVIAWTGLGVAIAGAGAFLVTTLMASDKYGSTGANNTFEWYRTQLDQGKEASTTAACVMEPTAPGCNYRAEARTLKGEIETLQGASYVALAAVGVGAATSLIFFVIGDPPGKYEAYRQKTGVVSSMSVSPTLNGVFVKGSF